MSNTLSETESLVSIICLCYNHEPYVKESLLSVIAQSYADIQLIVVDDASTDASRVIISNFDKQYKAIDTYLPLTENIGNCKAFNLGLVHAKGKYIIDLAADDILLPTCVENQVITFEQIDETFGVVYGDAQLINEKGSFLKNFYARDSSNTLLNHPPSGYIFQQLIRKYFLCTPTMMMKRKVLEELGGYDESLSYEDYDFWVRSSRNYQYQFIDKILVKKRMVANSLSTQFYLTQKNKNLESTLIVCKKALKLAKSKEEKQALAISVRYHLRLSFYTQNFGLVNAFHESIKSLTSPSVLDNMILLLSRYRIKIYWLYQLYLKIKKH